MTAQMGDRFKFDGKDYTIVALSERIRFNPKDYGIMPEAVCTACWNGFWCVFNIKDEGIFLEGLYINSKDGNYPPINGVKPMSGDENGIEFSYLGHHLYKGINLKIPYTGKLLVGGDFIPEYYIHMGYQRACGYRELVELVFKDGMLVETNDQSKIAAQIREGIKYPKNDIHNKKKRDFIEDSFSLDYGIKAWWL